MLRRVEADCVIEVAMMIGAEVGGARIDQLGMARLIDVGLQN
jgi:hypothetical protein